MSHEKQFTTPGAESSADCDATCHCEKCDYMRCGLCGLHRSKVTNLITQGDRQFCNPPVFVCAGCIDNAHAMIHQESKTEDPAPLSRLGEIEAAYKHYLALQEAFRRESGAGTLELAQKLYDRLEESGDYWTRDDVEWDTTQGQNGRVSFWARPRNEDMAGISIYLYATEDGGTTIDVTLRPLTYEKTVKLLDAIRVIEEQAP